MTTVHVPILAGPITAAMIEPFRKLPEDAAPHWIVDCTLGGGGHTAEFLKALAADPKTAKHKILSIDQDAGAIARAQERFATEIAQGRLELVHRRFSEAADLIRDRPTLGLLADLGFSSDQLEDAERGLSFQWDGPLDMRLDTSRGLSCREYLSQVTENELERVLRDYGEERFSRRLASAIVTRRRERQLPKTTKELSDLIIRALPPFARKGRIHAATRTFQALRIAVNGELEELDQLLDNIILGLQPGGRAAIISFHSLEDRKVKQAFKQSTSFEPLTKKPIEADEEEISRNPRSRSAKLRIAERTAESSA